MHEVADHIAPIVKNESKREKKGRGERLFTFSFVLPWGSAGHIRVSLTAVRANWKHVHNHTQGYVW